MGQPELWLTVSPKEYAGGRFRASWITCRKRDKRRAKDYTRKMSEKHPVARRLLSVGVPPTGMRVITFYKEQTLRSVPLLRDLGVYLATVDSIQGREMDVVIVLTTKTATATEASEFLDDHH
ncbi:unnamed protein product [Nippostrongylus brasiliensis]|uniref:AAA_12 domain-containing protein n=1 Tax=Nippostrongylus brasiliensis TaxID=27835 RepID=A0A0N4YT80_NIPBR|nr:hypothetical protein Q1695_011830 [Nippostrongylus brasiliensis]VDL84190.1 unnamed protein product [Nippostrongylus brasiliensis]